MVTGMFKVVATFHDSSANPLTGAEYAVKLLDEDRFFDDKLGSSSLDEDGVAEFLISVADVKSFDSLDERTPDLYFVVTKNDQEIFRSDVFSEVDFEEIDSVTGRPDSLTKSFGPFQLTSES